MSAALQSFRTNLEILGARASGIRDGAAEAIHDARVAARRLRAVLPIVHPKGRDHGEALAGMFKSLGAVLGKARDIDVSLELIAELERRVPGTAPAVATLRAQLLPVQTKRRRKLVKAFEGLDIESLERLAASDRASRIQAHILFDRVGELLRGHVDDLQHRIEHASGVYFPRRAHRVRVAVKKVRYAAELLEDDGDGVRRRALRACKRVQEALGHAHDRDVLMRRLKKANRAAPVPASEELLRVLEAECRDYFDAYRASRDEVITASHDVVHAAGVSRHRSHRSMPYRVLEVGAVAVPSATVILLARHLRRAS